MSKPEKPRPATEPVTRQAPAGSRKAAPPIVFEAVDDDEFEATAEAGRLYGVDTARERAALRDGTHPLCRPPKRAARSAG